MQPRAHSLVKLNEHPVREQDPAAVWPLSSLALGKPGISALAAGARTVYVFHKEQIAETGADGTDLEGITSLPAHDRGRGGRHHHPPAAQRGSYKVSVRTVTGVDASADLRRIWAAEATSRPPDANCCGSLDNAKAALLTEVEKAVMQRNPGRRQTGGLYLL